MNCRDPGALGGAGLGTQGEPEGKEKVLLNVTRNPVEAALFGARRCDGRTRRGADAPPQVVEAAGPPRDLVNGSSLGPALSRFRADLPLAILAAFAAVLVGVLAADPALAQAGGGTGSEINNAITQLSSWLATLVVSIGGVALLIAVIVWMFSGSNSQRREGAVRWIGTIIVAIFVGLSVPAIISLIQSFAGGGGGG
ncbi:hypothetical protein GBA63_22695 (plasmid) [Rubrobacter tropicus]|uniref:TrbC/VirB2 family protein n=1 Tax=Rubrobacter tropicus TaxID=2653851 RepID=A0A6G8QG81_9ACTN|nr:pilin [Rubrobacter tropicus]QIN85509.1 hypothetical protein GBA63_22695 [Rubrobacter tropicus]